MTAINVIVRPDAAYIATDGAWYDDEGILYGFAPKTYALAHWPGAIATRGPGLALAMIGAEVGLRFEDIDAFAPKACDFLQAIVTRPEWQLLCRVERKAVDLIVVGWSTKRNAPRAFQLSTGADTDLSRPDLGQDFSAEVFDNSEAYTLREIEVGQAMLLPLPDQDLLAKAGITADLDPDTLAPIDFAMRVLCAQRQWKDAPSPGAEPVHFVGGFGMLTTVNHRAVSQMKLNDWPDSIGRRIKARPFDLIPVLAEAAPAPEPSPPAPAGPPPGMNRAQRRTWEAEQRKKGGGAIRIVPQA